MTDLSPAAQAVADAFEEAWRMTPEAEGPNERIISIAKAVQECAFSHKPDVRLIGNVCAEDVADLCNAVLDRALEQLDD